MYILILIVTLYGNSVHTQHIDFDSLSACEKALSEVKKLDIKMSGNRPTVRGVCVAQK